MATTRYRALVVGVGLFGLAASPAFAFQPSHRTPELLPAIEGTVSRVKDGDGLIVATGSGEWVEIRLQGIDAPELNQTCSGSDGTEYGCGQAARVHLSRLAPAGSPIICAAPADDSIDQNGRLLAFCRVAAIDLSLRMLTDGQAVVFARYVSDHPEVERRAHADDFERAERSARDARRGLWAGTFTMPWEHRAARWRKRGG